MNIKRLMTACLVTVLLALFGWPSLVMAQTVNQYTNATAGVINDVDCGTAGQVTRNFTVPTSYVVGDVDLGVMLTHSYRSDLRITLRSPAGTSVSVMTWTGNVQSGDNLNDRFDDEATAAITTHNATVIDPQTPLPPPYSHSFQPSSPLSAFDGQNAAGTWTMIVCDAVASDVGNFARADLFISSTSLTAVKTSTVISDGINAVNPKLIPGATVQYCVLVTNAGATGTAPQTNVVMNDPLPSTITYVPGSLRSGSTCTTAATVEDEDAAGADESDPFGMSFGGTTVNGTAASLAVGAAFAMVFQGVVK